MAGKKCKKGNVGCLVHGVIIEFLKHCYVTQALDDLMKSTQTTLQSCIKLKKAAS
jgi:hypothetical protein